MLIGKSETRTSPAGREVCAPIVPVSTVIDVITAAMVTMRATALQHLVVRLLPTPL
jgi:hypothetical protein